MIVTCKGDLFDYKEYCEFVKGGGYNKSAPFNRISEVKQHQKRCETISITNTVKGNKMNSRL